MLTERVNVRLEPEQARAIESLAARRGMSPSTLIRVVLIEALSLPTNATNGSVEQQAIDGKEPARASA